MPDTPLPPSLPPSLTPRPAVPTASAPGPAAPRIGVAGSVGLLVVGLLATLGLLVLTLLLSLCGIGASGDECSDERRSAGLAVVAAGAVFLGVPALVAALRRDGRWLLVPVGEVALVLLLVAAADIF